MMDFSMVPVLGRRRNSDNRYPQPYHILNAFTYYADTFVPRGFFGFFLKMAQRYPYWRPNMPRAEYWVSGLLRLSQFNACIRQATEITYFIAPEYTCDGIGGAMLERLLAEASEIVIHQSWPAYLSQ